VSKESGLNGPGFGLPPTAVVTPRRDYAVSARGLECSFPSCGSLLESWSIAKYQIPIPNDQNKFGIWNFGHCYLFYI
jgi:hypothetical protein